RYISLKYVLLQAGRFIGVTPIEPGWGNRASSEVVLNLLRETSETRLSVCYNQVFLYFPTKYTSYMVLCQVFILSHQLFIRNKIYFSIGNMLYKGFYTHPSVSGVIPHLL